ncbi:MAG: hypothetical protein ACRDUB_10340 [Mycobacterium sp.]
MTRLAAAVVVLAVAGAPAAAAEPLATCSSDVIDGVEVDVCVGNPGVHNPVGVPGVNVDFEFGVGIGFGG